MAKRGGRSGRKYVRDSIGRFATTGATARGGRLKTKSGKKRATQTVKAKTGSKPAGTLKAKPRSEGQKYAKRVQAGKDLKRSQSTAREKKFFAKTQKRLDAAPLAQSRAAKPAAAKRGDTAEANIPMKGRRGKQLDASISKAAKQVKAAETARLIKPKAQRKSERAAKAEAKRQTAAAKPKRVRSAESLRVSRAKRITKERSISLNPAGNTQKGAGRMAANAKRTQERALAFYKGKPKPAAAKPAVAKTAKPAAAKRRKAIPKDGTDITREIGRAKGNKRIKNLNQQIKEAGPNAAGLRLEKLKVQTRMPNKPRQRVQPTAKQLAKEASRNDAIRRRSAELRAQSGRLQRGQDPATGGKKSRAKAAAAKPTAAKRKSKKVSADKVNRIIGRLSKDPSRKESIGMSSRTTKSRNTRETRTRALDFMNKAAGLKLKGKGSRPENPKGLNRDQMVANIAGKLAKPTKRSTLKNNSKVVAQRQQVRKSSREATASLRSSVKRQSRSAGASYAPGRVRLMPSRAAAASGTRPFYTDNKGQIFSGRTSFGSTKASRQSKLQSVRKLRGTGGLGSSISQIKRSKASQRTIGGGTQTTFGKFRTGFQKRRRS